jgi:hypothetical protein
MTRRLVATAGQGSLSCSLQGVTIDFWGGPQLQLRYGLGRPGPSSPDVPRTAGPQGAVCMQRLTPACIDMKGLSYF